MESKRTRWSPITVFHEIAQSMRRFSSPFSAGSMSRKSPRLPPNATGSFTVTYVAGASVSTIRALLSIASTRGRDDRSKSGGSPLLTFMSTSSTPSPSLSAMMCSTMRR